MPHAPTQLDVRVILLGRTGLDASLRTDAGIELVRVPTPLEAISELSATPCPGRRVVVVAPDAEAALQAESSVLADGTTGRAARGAPLQRIDEFVRALKGVDPGVTVLGVGRVGVRSPAAYDATISADLPADTLRRVVRGGAAPAQRPTSDLLDAVLASVPARRPAAATSPCPSAPEAHPDSPGDAALVALLLKGKDLLTPAIALLRERSGDPSVEFVPAGSPAGTPGVTETPVMWEAHHLGALRSSASSAIALAPHARWLAGWLRLRDQQSQLRQAAFSDCLTGAWNRRYFDRFLSAALDQARADRHHVTVLLFDIDNFKSFNDRYGHAAGDEILTETVRLLQSVIRPTDRVCRIGGDEFAVIFHEPTGPRQEGSRHPESVSGIAARFRQQIANHRFPKLADCAPGAVTLSGGLATFPWDGATPAALLARADERSMTSKRQGKNAITLGPAALR